MFFYKRDKPTIKKFMLQEKNQKTLTKFENN